MAFEQKPGSGALFPNDRKESEKHPDMRGDFNVDGKKYDIAGWWKQGKRGQFLSLTVREHKAPDLSSQVDRKPPQRAPQQRPPQQTEPPPQDDFYNDDIPF